MVSVIIPTYNRAKTIEASIRSVLSQTFQNLELIIVDDCSMDNTHEVVNSISDARLRYVRLVKNSGACAARNAGIDMAQGELIAFHDSDDLWHKDKLAKQIAVLQSCSADVCFCKMRRFSANGKALDIMPSHISKGLVPDKADLFGVGTQTLLGRKAVFETEKFDLAMPRFQDYELLIRIQRKFKIHCVDEALVDYTLSEDSISRNCGALLEAAKLLLKKYDAFQKEHPVASASIASILLSDLARNKSINDSNELKKEACATALRMSRCPKVLAKYFMLKMGLLQKVLK